jgi:hypothetical protein
MHHDSVGIDMQDSHGQKPVFDHVVVFMSPQHQCAKKRFETILSVHKTKIDALSYLPLDIQND